MAPSAGQGPVTLECTAAECEALQEGRRFAVAEGLIIVESPAKARTLKRFLGDRFDVRASMGHVRDLPERELAVDVEASFQPHYEVVEARKETLAPLKKARQGQAEGIPAPDPDPAGEGLGWHLAEGP